MLVLSRHARDSIMIGHDIVVTVLAISRDQVRLGIDAPLDVEVHREEVYRAIQEANRVAATGDGEASLLVEVAAGVKTAGKPKRTAGGGASTPGERGPAAPAVPSRSTQEATGNGTATP